MAEPLTSAGKKLLAKLKYDIDYEWLGTYAEMIRSVEIEMEQRVRADIEDERAEKTFLRPINPDPVNNFAKTLPRKGKA